MKKAAAMAAFRRRGFEGEVVVVGFGRPGHVVLGSAWSAQVDGALGSVGPGVVKPMSGVESMRVVQIRLVVRDDPRLLPCPGPRVIPVRRVVVKRAHMSVLMVHAPAVPSG
jgi:hypothetical protein